MKIIKRLRRSRRDSRGSALLVSLMVIVGLSLLGLGFVAISETESAIAKNQQNAVQTQAVAEAGAKVVVEWFQSPTWGIATGAMPDNSTAAVATGIIPAADAIKTERSIPGYTGVYKPRTNQMLCDKPYRPGNDHRLFGDEDHADVIINRTTSAASLDAFNNRLLASNGATATAEDMRAGEVTEIKIFAPPIVGGTLVNGFWSGGQRYGVASIKVTSQQFQDPAAHTGVIASHSVRLVVGELPLPIPAGPIQGNANVSFGGNFRVHWGMETSTLDIDPSLNLVALPWANAYERPHFEHGYEPGSTVASVTVTTGGAGYATPPTVTFDCTAPACPSGSGAAGTAVVTGGVVTSVTITSRGTNYNQQYPPTITFTPVGGGAGAAANVAVAAEVWPVSGGNFDDQDYFHEIIDKSYQDPWYGVRAVQDNLIDGVTAPNVNPQCYPYSYTNDEDTNNNPSYDFQWQDANVFPWKRRVLFPVIRYEYWKRIAQQGRGYQGIYYFTYDTATSNFKKFGTGAAQAMAYWVNTVNGARLGPGVYFFDTRTGQNPQVLTGAARTAILTPPLGWSTADFLGGMLMQGFVYMNSQEYGTTGGGTAQTVIQANFPGEPFRDAGYPRWDVSTNTWFDCSGTPCRSGGGDATFSYQDLNGNGNFDVVVMQRNFDAHDPGVIAHAGRYVVKTWKSVAVATADYGAPCNVPAAGYDGTNPGPNDCSEPHEPYLNVVYPATAAPPANGANPTPMVIGWEAPASQTYRAKKLDSSGNPVSCAGTPSQDDCVSNAYDVDGAVVPLEVVLYGILYNEGTFGSAGNCWYYGSILIQDNVGATGTADVWFDEKLIKGSWAPPGMPRVIVFSEQTDESSQ